MTIHECHPKAKYNKQIYCCYVVVKCKKWRSLRACDMYIYQRQVEYVQSYKTN